MLKYILLLSLGLRLALAAAAFFAGGGPTAFHTLDTGSYIGVAEEWAATGRFQYAGQAEIVRTPGYPLLLLPGVLLGQVEAVAVLFQALLGCLTVYLVYRVALLAFGNERAALVAALFYAVEPLSLLFTVKVLSETLFTALITGFLFFLLRYLRERSAASLILAALSLAASAYVRPISLYLPWLIALFLLGAWVIGRKERAVPALGALLLFLGITIGGTSLWQLRNAQAADYHGFSAITELNWYYYQGAAVLAAQRGVPYYAVQQELGYSDPEVYFRQHPEQRAWSQGRVYEYQGAEGRRIALSDLGTYIPIYVGGMAKTLVNPGGVEFLKAVNLYPEEGGEYGIAVNAGLKETVEYLLARNPLLLAVNLLFGVLLAFYVLAGLVALGAKRSRNASLLALVGVAAYLVLMSGGPQSLSRFRHPVMPELCVLAGQGLVVALYWWRSRGAKRGDRATAAPPHLAEEGISNPRERQRGVQ